jgi:putative intracellular protease/amidase
MKSKKILFITTSHDQIEETHASTGVWLEELASPYYVFKDAGADITIASPKGGPIPLEPKSQSILIITRSGKRFLKDLIATDFLSCSSTLAEVKANNFDLVFLPGGHGAMWDIADNELVNQLLESFNTTKKLIGAVSHGVAGLLSLQNDNGEPLLKSKQLTAFSNSEEESTGLKNVLPFLLETKLATMGALYHKGTNYTSHVVTDGNIITGQNPASAEDVARKIVSLAKDNQYNQRVMPTF